MQNYYICTSNLCQSKLLKLVLFFWKPLYNDSKYKIITEKLVKQHNDNLIHIRKGRISDVSNKPSELIINGMWI